MIPTRDCPCLYCQTLFHASPSSKSMRAEELGRYDRAKQQIADREIARQRASACRHGHAPGVHPPCRTCSKLRKALRATGWLRSAFRRLLGR